MYYHPHFIYPVFLNMSISATSFCSSLNTSYVRPVPISATTQDLLRASARDQRKYQRWDEEIKMLLNIVKNSLTLQTAGKDRQFIWEARLSKYHTQVHGYLENAQYWTHERERLLRRDGISASHIRTIQYRAIVEGDCYDAVMSQDFRQLRDEVMAHYLHKVAPKLTSQQSADEKWGRHGRLSP